MWAAGKRASSADAPMVSSSGCAARTAMRNETSGGSATSRRRAAALDFVESTCQFMQRCLAGKYANRFPISVQRAHIHVHVSTLHSVGGSTIREIRVHESANVFIRPRALVPQLMQFSKMPSSQLERTPNPL